MGWAKWAIGAAVVLGIASLGDQKAANDDKGKGLDTPGDETRFAVPAPDGSGLFVFIGQVDNAVEPFRWRVATPTADGGSEPVPNAVDWAATQEAALAEAKAWIAENMSVVTEPKKPPPPPIPQPGPEGATGPDATSPPPLVCETMRTDGEFVVCIYRNDGGWGFRATNQQGITVATKGGYEDRKAAIVESWVALAPMPTIVVSAPIARNGVRLEVDGTAELVDWEAFKGRARPILAQQIGKGETGLGLVLPVWEAMFPSANPLRIKPKGHDLQAIADYVNASNQTQPDDVAAAIWAPWSVAADS